VPWGKKRASEKGGGHGGLGDFRADTTHQKDLDVVLKNKLSGNYEFLVEKSSGRLSAEVRVRLEGQAYRWHQRPSMFPEVSVAVTVRDHPKKKKNRRGEGKDLIEKKKVRRRPKENFHHLWQRVVIHESKKNGRALGEGLLGKKSFFQRGGGGSFARM